MYLLSRERPSEGIMGSDQKEILCLCLDELTLQVRQMLLEHFGYKVFATDSVDGMNAILRQACPDMLLLDTNDPELDCQHLADTAKSICPDILSVVLTPDYGLHGNSCGSIDHFLRLDGPREEWLSGIESLFAKQNSKGRGTSSALM
jgi:hypothetical protein